MEAIEERLHHFNVYLLDRLFASCRAFVSYLGQLTLNSAELSMGGASTHYCSFLDPNYY